jgi:hypothetical protein
MEKTELIALSADPKAQSPTTIRQVMRAWQDGYLMTTDADLDGSAQFFMDCLTVRHLLADGEIARADLVASQTGATLAQFGYTSRAELVITKADGVLDLPAMQQAYTGTPDRLRLLRELRDHVAHSCPEMKRDGQKEQVRLAANATMRLHAGSVTLAEVAGYYPRD